MRTARHRGLEKALAGVLLAGCLHAAPAMASRGPAQDASGPGERFTTDRPDPRPLALPEEEESFVFAVFGDRTGGPREGIEVLRRAVADVNLLAPDLVMTVGDLVEGYNDTPAWLEEMREFKSAMDGLSSPWFPVAGNHDVYWRGPDGEKPAGEHEASYEAHLGPLWYAFRHEGATFVVLYSDEGDPTTGRKSFSDPVAQTMSPEQFAWLADTLEQARDAQHVFVFLHHPRWLRGGYGDDWDRVHDVLARAGNVTAVFAGHVHHMRYDGVRDGIEYVTLATVGGEQPGIAPEAGYLHHYLLVHVRPSSIAITSYPVGSAMDPRAITGEVSEEVYQLAGALQLEGVSPLVLTDDLGAAGELRFVLANPVSRPVELELQPVGTGSGWSFFPDHAHLSLAPGEREELVFRVSRPSGLPESTFRLPALAVLADYLAPAARFSLPRRELPLPLDASALAPPQASEAERGLVLDGEDDHARVAHDQLDLPDGPLTLETWVRIDTVRPGQGVVAKTESSEFGLFLSDERPAFYLHVGGRYAVAESGDAGLAAGAWHHLAGVFDGAEVRLYLDGRRVAAKAAAGKRTRNGLPLVLGADVTGAGDTASHMHGALDEVRLSRVARYDADFRPRRRFEPDTDTALLLHADGPRAAWLFDDSPARAHAMLRSGARVVAVSRD